MVNKEVTLTTDDLMSIKDAAEALNRPRITIYRWVEKGKLLFVKFGGIYYIPVSEVERLKNNQIEEEK